MEYLLAAAKSIRSAPSHKQHSPVRVEVFRKSTPNNPVRGLIVTARVRHPPSGLPKPYPSAALEWHGIRIRGLNYEIWHDNPDGGIVRGWHEHIWSLEHGDKFVIPARPEPKNKTMLGILKWGLEKWNIAVLEQQLEVSDE